MKEKIYIGVAWPYANGSLHLGHIAGCYLPADIFARFCRMNGKDVLMVSGSDEHGTPITISADNEKVSPQKIVDRFNKEHTENMKQMGISFDLFTRTTTENHSRTVQEIFLKLYEKDYIYKKEVESFYCPDCDRFLPDRYVEGCCPHCGNNHARGDQCDECGKLLECRELDEVQCKICGGKPELRTTEHLYFALSKFESKIGEWIKDKKHWKSSVLKFTQNWLSNGLNDRAITRDMKWGVEVPLKGFDNKRIYVWFDAVIGYLSASKEWSFKQGKDDKWKEWWYDKKTKHYYFLAKDNIPFHSLIWPSILMGYDDELNLPYDIPANEYLRLKGEQFSKSRGIAVWVPDIIKNFDVDAVRYYLSINMPENKDSNWLWDDFVAKNNDELLGTYGNFVHRVITFTHKNFEEIPKVDESDIDKEVIEKIKNTTEETKNELNKCNFKIGLRSAMNLAQFGNIYFDKKQPWALIKQDEKECKAVLHNCIKIVKALSILTAPYLPFSSETIWEMIGEEGSVHESAWKDAMNDIKVGYRLTRPKPLFKKLLLDDIMTEEDPFSKADLRVAKVLEVKDHPQADKLYMINLDLGGLGKRVIVAGMKPYYSKEEITQKNIVIVTNLKPAKIRGVTSNGMLLAAEDDEGVVSLLDPGDAKPGSELTIEGIQKNPSDVLEFEDFKKIKLTVDDDKKIIYNGKFLMSEKGKIKTDKPVKKGAKVQ